MSLIITRPEPDASALAKKLIARGHKVILLPLLEIVPDKTARLPQTIGAFAFTSANGARLAARVANGARLTAHYIKSNTENLFSRPVFAIGEQTHAAARRAGFTKIINAPSPIDNSTQDQDRVDSFAKTIIASRASFDGPIIHCVGRHQAGNLVRALRAAKIEAHAHILYEARAIKDFTIAPDAIKTSEGVLLYSRRTAEAFLAYWRTHIKIPPPPSFTAYCWSPAIAAPVQEAGFATKTLSPPNAQNEAAFFDLLNPPHNPD